FLELFLCVPVIVLPTPDEDRRDAGSDVWRSISPEHDDRRGVLVGGSAVGHRGPLREAEEHESWRMRKRADHAPHVRLVVGDGELAVLPRHPARDDLLRATEIERM